MKIGIKREVEVDVKYVTVHVKAVDQGTYELLDSSDNVIAELSEEYVPNKVIPGSYGDYIELKIDLETSQIVNWKKPSIDDILVSFKLKDEE